MSRRIKHVLVRVGITLVVISNLFLGFPIDSLIAALNARIEERTIVDSLYWALRDPAVVDSGRAKIATTVRRASAATVSTQMAERYVGARSNTTTAISNYSFNWQAPTGITSLTVEARAGGSGGGGSNGTSGGGGGGGGGGYALSNNVSVSEGNTYSINVGRGGNGGAATAAGGAGTNSTFGSLVVADAGSGGGAGTNGTAGAGGATNTGDTTFNGGAGSTGVAASRSGAGGGGAGDAGNGSAASGTTGGSGGSAGGGTGANGRTTDGVGNPATNIYGAGGGGGYRTGGTNRAGGAGASGIIDITYDYNADNSYPIIKGISGSRSNNANSTSHAITLPPNIEAGDLLVAVFSTDGTATVTVNTGVSGSNWVKLGQATGNSAVVGAVFYKIAEGSDVLTLTTSASEQSSHLVYRISNYALPPSGVSATGAGASSDPGSHSTTTANYLWIATRSGDSTTAATAAPSGYSFWRQADAPGTGGASTDAAVLFSSNDDSEDPGTWTSNTDDWASWTLAIPGPTPPAVTTDAASSVGASSAALNANITDDGGATVATRGFASSTSSDLSSSVSTTTESGSFSTGAFTGSMGGLTGNTTYYFRAFATNSVGTSFGAIESFLTLPGAPGAPSLSLVAATSTTVSWDAPTGGVSTYKLQYCENNTANCVLSTGLAVTSTTTNPSLTGNTTYSFAVRGTNATGDGAFSASTTQLMLPDIPGNPSFSAVTQTTMTISWDAPTGGASSYKLERCTGAACTDFVQIYSGATASYDDSSLDMNTFYRYRVRATNATGDGLYSSITTQRTEVQVPTMARKLRLQGIRLINGLRIR